MSYLLSNPLPCTQVGVSLAFGQKSPGIGCDGMPNRGPLAGCQSGAMVFKLLPKKIYECQVGNYRHQRTEEDVLGLVVCSMLLCVTDKQTDRQIKVTPLVGADNFNNPTRDEQDRQTMIAK